MKGALGPLGEGIKRLIKEDKSRFFTPGHKGKAVFPVGDGASWDYTEVAGSDSLYEAKGIIAQSEEEFSQLYGCTTLLSAGGSTLGVQAMLTLGVGPNKSLLLSRNCHISAVHTMGLLNIQPVWLPSQVDPDSGLEKRITGGNIYAMLLKYPEMGGVYLTSPDYYGRLAPVEEISKVCKKFKVPLLVDSAHGAHLKFTRQDLFPLSLGADLCCTSLHKTLPVLTGGALLHLGKNWSREDGKKAMALYGSTSPSYLILLSADALLPVLRGEGRQELVNLEDRVREFSEKMVEKGYKQLSHDPLRLTVDFRDYGYTKEAFLQVLDALQVEAEYTDESFAVFLPGLFQPQRDWKRLEGLLTLPRKESLQKRHLTYPLLRQVVSLREALFAPSRPVPVKDAVGKIAGAMVVLCPPGIPLLIPGEEITQEAVDTGIHHGVSQISVL